MHAGSNPIYNLLPDILGRLSGQDLERESFCNIMQFLIGSIKKVRFCLHNLSVAFSSHFPSIIYSFEQSGQANGSSC